MSMIRVWIPHHYMDAIRIPKTYPSLWHRATVKQRRGASQSYHCGKWKGYPLRWAAVRKTPFSTITRGQRTPCSNWMSKERATLTNISQGPRYPTSINHCRVIHNITGSLDHNRNTTTISNLTSVSIRVIVHKCLKNSHYTDYYYSISVISSKLHIGT